MQEFKNTFLLEKLQKEYNAEEYAKILAGFNCHRKVNLRINTLSITISACKEKLKALGVEYQEVSYFPNALIILNKTERELEATDLYKEGKIYLQNLSSMLPPLFLEPKAKEDILDMAAAPGGKTTEIAILTAGKALITACEKNKIRAERLKYNLAKQQVNNVNVFTIDAAKLDDFFRFDRILLDAPCTGSGTVLLEESKSNQEFSHKYLEQVTKSQWNLLKKGIDLLKKGGTLIYSTCSLFKEENEEIVRKALATKKVALVKIPQIAEITHLNSTLAEVITVCPNELYEGFFVAKFIKL